MSGPRSESTLKDFALISAANTKRSPRADVEHLGRDCAVHRQQTTRCWINFDPCVTLISAASMTWEQASSQEFGREGLRLLFASLGDSSGPDSCLAGVQRAGGCAEPTKHSKKNKVHPGKEKVVIVQDGMHDRRYQVNQSTRILV